MKKIKIHVSFYTNVESNVAQRDFSGLLLAREYLCLRLSYRASESLRASSRTEAMAWSERD